MKRIFTILVLVLSLSPLFFIETANAQWSIGASYEVRDEDPTNGFGVRIEKGILNFVPVVDLGVRAHFSYFNENNSVSEGEVTYDQEIQSYDVGLAAVAGVDVAVVKPYVGLGIGTENYDFSSENQGDFNENNFYWNGFGGLEVTVIPVIKPFIEYRITGLTNSDDVEFDNVGRTSIGFSLRF